MHKHITVQLNRPLLLESALSKGLGARINPGVKSDQYFMFLRFPFFSPQENRPTVKAMISCKLWLSRLVVIFSIRGGDVSKLNNDISGNHLIHLIHLMHVCFPNHLHSTSVKTSYDCWNLGKSWKNPRKFPPKSPIPRPIHHTQPQRPGRHTAHAPYLPRISSAVV